MSARTKTDFPFCYRVGVPQLNRTTVRLELYYEKFYFTPGDLGFQSFQTRFGRIGVLICWDQWYPEAARLTALRGAEMIFYPSAIGWHPSEKVDSGESQYQAWRTIQQSHAIANGVFVAAVNRVAGPSFQFSQRSGECHSRTPNRDERHIPGGACGPREFVALAGQEREKQSG